MRSILLSVIITFSLLAQAPIQLTKEQEQKIRDGLRQQGKMITPKHNARQKEDNLKSVRENKEKNSTKKAESKRDSEIK
jgi:hypothetical protein